MSFPKVIGVFRVAGNDNAVVVSFARPLTDDELQCLHEEIKLMEYETIVNPFETAH